MTEKKKEWKITENRFVAFLDILGFKDKVMRSSHEDIYKELKKISSLKRIIEKSVDDEIVTKNFKDVDIYIVSFSDSIVLFSRNDSIDNFKFFTFALRVVFASAIKNGIPLKGGLSHGEISINKSDQIYFGQPIIDAYLIEEEVNYLGVVCHNSIDKYLNEKNDNIESLNNGYKFINTPLKCGNIKHYNLDWYYPLFRDIQEHKSKEEKIEYIKSVIEKFYLTCSGSPRRYIDNSIKLLDEMSSKDLITLEPTILK